MKDFYQFIEEAATKRCKTGYYYCFDEKKCKKIPGGYHVGRGGYLEKDDEKNTKKGDSNGSEGNGDSNGGNGNGGGGE